MFEQLTLDMNTDLKSEIEDIVQAAREKYGYFTAHISGYYELEATASPKELYYILSVLKNKDNTVSVFIDNKKFKLKDDESKPDIEKFVEDECSAKMDDNKRRTKEAKLYQRYCQWCDDMDKEIMPLSDFSLEMGQRFSFEETAEGRIYIGIILTNKSSNIFFKVNPKKKLVSIKSDVYQALNLKVPCSTSREIFKNSVTIPFEDEESLLELFKLVLDYQIQHYIPAHRFSCCGRYQQCSAAGKCLHPHNFYSKGCYYRSNLQKSQGVIK